MLPVMEEPPMLSILVIARSDTSSGVSVSVALLLLGLVSVVPAGTSTVAVLTRSPVAEDRAVPVTVTTTEVPDPGAMLTVAARLLPKPLAPLLTEALPLVVEVQITLVRVAGMVSATVAPTASLGPLFVTVMV